jgi:hypothetical protein
MDENEKLEVGDRVIIVMNDNLYDGLDGKTVYTISDISKEGDVVSFAEDERIPTKWRINIGFVKFVTPKQKEDEQ